LKLGFTHIFVFFDDPGDKDSDIIKIFSNVTAIPCDEALHFQQKYMGQLYDQHAPYIQNTVMSRQILNLETGIQLALDMDMDWILHIDVDELFYWSQGSVADYFSSIPPEVEQVMFSPLEGAPESFEMIDYFQEVTLFKQNFRFLKNQDLSPYFQTYPRKWYFLGYENGKSAARLKHNLLPAGVHSFQYGSGGEVYPATAFVQDPCILHYINCGFSFYQRKYNHRGAFDDKWWGKKPVQQTFSLASRDAFIAGDPGALEKLYREYVLFDKVDENQYLQEIGILLRIDFPRRLLTDSKPSLEL
jgi:hypothetical protein